MGPGRALENLMLAAGAKMANLQLPNESPVADSLSGAQTLYLRRSTVKWILCGVGLPGPRDQTQREANAAFLIDSDYGEASTWEVSLRTFDQRRSLCPRRLREIPAGRRQTNTEKWNHKGCF